MADGVILYAYVDADSTCDYYGKKVKQHTIEKIDYLSGHPSWFQEEFKTYFEEHQEDYEPGWLADTEEIIEVGCIAEVEDYEGESIKYDFLLARKEGEIKILSVLDNGIMPSDPGNGPHELFHAFQGQVMGHHGDDYGVGG